jgi:hypothetical protein
MEIFQHKYLKTKHINPMRKKKVFANKYENGKINRQQQRHHQQNQNSDKSRSGDEKRREKKNP